MAIDQHIRSILLRQRGQNRALAEEITNNLSHEAKLRLLHVLQDMERETASAKSRLRRGQFRP